MPAFPGRVVANVDDYSNGEKAIQSLAKVREARLEAQLLRERRARAASIETVQKAQRGRRARAEARMRREERTKTKEEQEAEATKRGAAERVLPSLERQLAELQPRRRTTRARKEEAARAAARAQRHADQAAEQHGRLRALYEEESALCNAELQAELDVEHGRLEHEHGQALVQRRAQQRAFEGAAGGGGGKGTYPGQAAAREREAIRTSHQLAALQRAHEAELRQAERAVRDRLQPAHQQRLRAAAAAMGTAAAREERVVVTARAAQEEAAAAAAGALCRTSTGLRASTGGRRR